MLELINLQKRYAERSVLDGASLTVSGGEAVALVGANGSGKTTTLRCAVGLHHLNGGHVRVDGIDPSRDGRAARALLSYLPQRADFPLTLTVREILQVAARLRDLPDGAVERELSLCGLMRLASRTVSRLSGGERQRVALAMLLMPDVHLYLLDEPTASLDAGGAQLLIDRVCALRDAGRAVLFTTHIGGELDRLATRVAMLREGRIEPADETDSSHVVADLGESAASWVAAAMALRANRAWAVDSRLHFTAAIESAPGILAGLQDRGMVIQAFRTERQLRAALDLVHEEEGRGTADSADADVRSRVPGCLRRTRVWPRAATARSR